MSDSQLVNFYTVHQLQFIYKEDLWTDKWLPRY